MWTLRDGPGPGEQDSVWAVFKSHEQVGRFTSQISIPRPFPRVLLERIFVHIWTRAPRVLLSSAL